MIRPSDKEINNKIKQAKNMAATGKFNILEPTSLAVDALELEYLVEDLHSVLSALLDELKPADYAGHRPPQRSYEKKILDCELFAFEWQGKTLKTKIYLKFTLKNNRLWLVSLHKSRKKKGEKQ